MVQTVAYRPHGGAIVKGIAMMEVMSETAQLARRIVQCHSLGVIMEDVYSDDGLVMGKTTVLTGVTKPHAVFYTLCIGVFCWFAFKITTVAGKRQWL